MNQIIDLLKAKHQSYIRRNNKKTKSENLNGYYGNTETAIGIGNTPHQICDPINELIPLNNHSYFINYPIEGNDLKDIFPLLESGGIWSQSTEVNSLQEKEIMIISTTLNIATHCLFGIDYEFVTDNMVKYVGFILSIDEILKSIHSLFSVLNDV